VADIDSANTIFKLLGGGVVAIGAWAMRTVHKNLSDRLDVHDKRLRTIETSDCREVFDKKLTKHIDETRSETNDLRKETQESIVRLHDKLDTCVRDLTKNQNDQTNRIIALIQNGNGNAH